MTWKEGLATAILAPFGAVAVIWFMGMAFEAQVQERQQSDICRKNAQTPQEWHRCRQSHH